MPRAPWALARFSTASGCLVHGRLLNNLYLLPMRNYFRLSWQLNCGVLSGLRGGSSSFVIESVAVLLSGTSRDAHFISFTAVSVRGKANLGCGFSLSFSASTHSALGPTGHGNSNANSSSSPDSAASYLTARCQFFLTQGLVPYTRRVYLSAQRRYAEFYRQEGLLNPEGVLVPADEQSLMRFASLLADNLHH